METYLKINHSWRSVKGWPNWVFELDALYDWRTTHLHPVIQHEHAWLMTVEGTCCIRGDTRDGDGLFSLLGICGGCVLFWCCVFCLFVKCAWCKWKISNWKRGCKGKDTKKNATGKWFKRNNMAATLFFFHLVVFCQEYLGYLFSSCLSSFIPLEEVWKPYLCFPRSSTWM